MEHIVLAYAGDRDGSIALGWLAQQPRTRVVTLTLDVGQGRALEDVRERALSLGAARAHVVDARDEFARDYLWPALAAGAVQASIPLGHLLTAPLLARHLAQVADVECATAVAHAASSPQAIERMDRSVRALNPALEVRAVLREWGLTDREQTALAAAMGLPSAWTADDNERGCNLWERAIVARVTADGGENEDVFRRTRAAGDTPDEPAVIDIAFERGVPVGTNGVALSNADLITTLETIAGVHGVGRVTSGSGVTYEAPAAVVLEAAHTALQRHSRPADLESVVAAGLGEKYVDLIESGRWYSPTRHALDACVGKAQGQVTGEVSVSLFKGRSDVTAVRAIPAPAEVAGAAPVPVGKDL